MYSESQQRQPLLGNGSVNKPVTRQWLSNRHVMVATEELLEEVFCAVCAEAVYITRTS
jgi:hypothetical protein